MPDPSVNDFLSEERASQEARTTELMLEQQAVQEKINALKKEYKTASKDAQEGIRKQIEEQAKLNRALKDEMKILGLIGNQLDDNIGVMDRESLLAFDIVGAKKKQAAIDKQIALLHQKKGDLTGKDLDKVNEMIKKLEEQAGLGKRINEETMQAASEAQTLNKSFDMLLGNFGLSVDKLEKMKDSTGILGQGMMSIKTAVVAGLVVGLGLAVKYMIELVKGSIALQKELGVGYDTAKGFKKAFDDAQFSVGFFGQRVKDLFTLDMDEFTGGFRKAAENYFLDIDLKDAVNQLKTQFKGIQDGAGGLLNEKQFTEKANMMAKAAQMLGTDVATMAKASKNLMNLTGMSFEGAQVQLLDMAKELKKSGIAEGDFMADMANNAEDVARYMKESGTNIFKAAAAARKMGVELGTLTKISSSLLDFESSIEAEMQASLMVGKQLNYDKARQLALEGDIAGAARNVVDQIGGAAEFAKMNVLQRDALAASIGVDVNELSAMITGRKKQSPEQKEAQETREAQIQAMKASEANTNAIDRLTETINSSTLMKDVDKAVDASAGISKGVLMGLPAALPGGTAAMSALTNKILPDKLDKVTQPEIKTTKSGRFKVDNTKGPGFLKEEDAVKKAQSIAQETAEELAKQSDETAGFFSKLFGKVTKSKTLKVAGKGTAALGVAMDVYNVAESAMDETQTKQDTAKVATEAVTGGLAAAAAAAATAALATSWSGPGALVAGLVAGGVAYLGGSKLGGMAADELDIGGTSELTASNAQAQIAQEFRDLSGKQQADLKKAVEDGATSTKELLTVLREREDKNDSDMAELITIMQAVVDAQLGTNTSVKGLVNN